MFSPTNEFKLDTWFSAGPIDFNKGVLYVLLAAAITLGMLLYMAKRLRERPGRLQVAIEMFYSLTRNMADESLDESMSRKYFPLIATLFIFILVSNLIGYIPLPIDTGEKFTLFGAHMPVVPDLRGGHERRLPADARAARVRALHLRGHQASTARSATSRA